MPYNARTWRETSIISFLIVSRYKITKTEEAVFSWAFQKLSEIDYSTESKYTLKDDRAIIYAINITNTLGGGASSCKKCPKGATDSG